MSEAAKSEPANDNGTGAALPARRCPICGRPAAPAEKPFCSRRCADVDLHRWLGGVYAVPADPAEDEGLADAEPDRF